MEILMDGWREVMIATPREELVSEVDSFFESIALWMTIRTHIDLPLQKRTYQNQSNREMSETPIKSASLESEAMESFHSNINDCHGDNSECSDDGIMIDYFKPNLRWTGDRVVRMINKRNICDQLSRKTISDVCKKLNLHLVVREVTFTGNTYKNREVIDIGKVILDIRPHSTFNRTVASYGNSICPRKVLLFRDSFCSTTQSVSLCRTDAKSGPKPTGRYSLVVPDTVDARSIMTYHNTITTISSTFNMDMCTKFCFRNCVVDECKLLKELCDSVVESTLENWDENISTHNDQSLPEHHSNDLRLNIESNSTPGDTKNSFSQSRFETDRDCSRNDKIRDKEYNQSLATKDRLSRFISEKIGVSRKKIAQFTEEVDSLIDQQNRLVSQMTNTHSMNPSPEILDNTFAEFKRQFDVYKTQINLKKVSIVLEEDCISALIKKMDTLHTPQHKKKHSWNNYRF